LIYYWSAIESKGEMLMHSPHDALSSPDDNTMTVCCCRYIPYLCRYCRL